MLQMKGVNSIEELLRNKNIKHIWSLVRKKIVLIEDY